MGYKEFLQQPKQVSERVKLVDFIKDNKVKAIFVESSVSPDAIKSIAEDSGVIIGGELFSMQWVNLENRNSEWRPI